MDVQPQICNNCMMLSCQYGQKYFQYIVEYILLRMKAGSFSKLYLIKWPVNVCFAYTVHLGLPLLVLALTKTYGWGYVSGS